MVLYLSGKILLYRIDARDICTVFHFEGDLNNEEVLNEA